MRLKWGIDVSLGMGENFDLGGEGMMGMENGTGAAVVRQPKALSMEDFAWTNFVGSIVAMVKSSTKKVSSRVTRSL
jgi:hypothetical protein